uniref:Uncharacterized protein n=1 Tax=Arundo donax TaxID=35708 RepID=A0A0A9DYT9_ARUDO
MPRTGGRQRKPRHPRSGRPRTRGEADAGMRTLGRRAR